MHVSGEPYLKPRYAVPEGEVSGVSGSSWKERASYTVTLTVIIQIQTTNVSSSEYAIAPNITFMSTNEAIINIYRRFSIRHVSFEEFNRQYALAEAEVESYANSLVSKLNASRRAHRLPSNWYINTALDERTVEAESEETMGDL